MMGPRRGTSYNASTIILKYFILFLYLISVKLKNSCFTFLFASQTALHDSVFFTKIIDMALSLHNTTI